MNKGIFKRFIPREPSIVLDGRQSMLWGFSPFNLLFIVSCVSLAVYPAKYVVLAASLCPILKSLPNPSSARPFALLSLIVVLLFPPIPALADAAKTQRVLLLHSYGPDYEPYSNFADSLASELVKRSQQPIDLYEASVFSARFEEPSDDHALKDYLNNQFDTRKPNLIITIGSPAKNFAQHYRSELFPGTPLLFTGIAARRIHNNSLTENDSVVAASLDLNAIFDNIFRVLPDTSEVTVVIGNSKLERYWVNEMRRHFRPFENHAKIRFLNESPLQEMLTQVANQPPHSAILYFMLAIDAAGIPYPHDRAFAPLRAAANAPMFGLEDFLLGKGIVGGPLIPIKALASEAAAAADRILMGQRGGDIRPPPMPIAPPAYDWRELQRWSINESHLPRDAVIRFRVPTLSSQYRNYIIGGALLIGIQSFLIVGLVMQRSRLRRAETNLRESEHIYRTTLANITDAAFITKTNGDFTFISPNVQGIFGYSIAEVERMHNISHLLGKDIFEQSALDAMGEVTNIELRVQGKNHSEHDLLVNVKLVHINEGRILYTCRDVTDRRRAEETRRNLLYAQRLAGMGELTAMIAHEVNQPLGAILSNAEAAEMLLTSDKPPLHEIRQILADIRNNDLRANEAIRRIRTLLRKREIHLEPFDLNAMVMDVLQLITGDALRRQIQVHMELASDLPEVCGDRVYLQQVMLNLIVNAMDAVSDNPLEARHITIRSLPHDGDNDDAEIVVSDNGHGIPTDRLPKIFQSFVTTKREGMGLGLSIARSIIDMHGGHIWAENNDNGGAVFHFTVRTISPLSVAGSDAMRFSKSAIEQQGKVARSS